MDSLYIGFSKPKKFKLFSWIITKIEKTEYSHVYIRFYSKKYERYLVYQASATMVNFMEWMRFIEHCDIVKEFELPITDECKTKIIKKAIDLVGAPYGIKQILGLGYVILMKYFNITVNNPFSDKNETWVCSEVVYDALRELGYSMFIHQDEVTPKHIYEFLENKLNGQN